jgi:4-hydroxymandelate oxidase
MGFETKARFRWTRAGAATMMAGMPRTSRPTRSVPLPAAERAPVNVAEYEPLARARLTPMAYHYIAGGSGDEITMRRNRECLDAIRIKPRVLRDVRSIDTRLELLGDPLEFPVLLAPTGFQGLYHPLGEIAAARGAEAARTIYIASTVANTAIADIARASGARLWFQLYAQKDHGFTRELIERAEAAGCRALCLTVDTPVLGPRDREKRENFAMPPDLRFGNLDVLSGPYTAERHHDPHGIHNPFLNPGMTWETVDAIRSATRLPLVLKGILAAEDARFAVEHGVAAIAVSNHGGRNLDTVPASIEALPGVVEAVAGRVPVLFDGGVRRGVDVVKALALGARAVMIGRPYLWGLAVGGAAGVQRVVEILRLELEAAMALLGVASLASLDRGVVWPEQ